MLTISRLFREKPSSFGLRGDNLLWEELEVHFKTTPLPDSEVDLQSLLAAQILELTKNGKCQDSLMFDKKTGEITQEERINIIQVNRYSHRGMSGSCVSLDWWRKKGIPILLQRFMAIK